MTTRQFFTRVAKLGWVQIIAGIFFTAVLVIALAGPPTIPYQYGTVPGYGLAAAAFVAVLFVPSSKWLRVLTVIVPTAAAGGRMLDMLLSDPLRWGGFTTWGFVAFTCLMILPDYLPPPLLNGKRREWLGNGVG